MLFLKMSFYAVFPINFNTLATFLQTPKPLIVLFYYLSEIRPVLYLEGSDVSN